MSDSSVLLNLFNRPLEQAFLLQNDGKTVLDIPESFYPDRYESVGANIQSRFDSTDDEVRIPIKNVIPDVDFAKVIDRQAPFSLFLEKHRKISGKLIEVFIAQPDVASLMGAATYCKMHLNPSLFNYALSVAIQHRTDTQNLTLPSMVSMFPDQFIDPSTFPKLKEELILPPSDRVIVNVKQNFTASDREEEQRMAYFREDIGVNMHHWHWHLVYPGQGPAEIVNKDRRGELFWYMHSQLLIRYNTDRFAHRLPRVKPLNNFRERIPEAYFPKMVRTTKNNAYPARPYNSELRDIKRLNEGEVFEIADLERWRDRVLGAIDQGFVFDTTGKQIPLDDVKGIDILGDILEATDLSPNKKLYGSLHNYGHTAIAYIHDPDHRYLEDYGVMGDVTTAMRDPVFYRWHKQIDDMCYRFKDGLTPYTSADFAFEGITVKNLSAHLNKANSPQNHLLTFWQKSDVDLGAGLDFGPGGKAFVSFTHLQHAPFHYNISIHNANNALRRGTARIFLATKIDEQGMALTLQEQRKLMIEMDKFTVNLKPGDNIITRNSEQSSVTIPYERSFGGVPPSQPIDTSAAKPSEIEKHDMARFCSCGWPAHMLLPKGTSEGSKYDLFVMISNFNDDVVLEFDETRNCSDAHSFCGLRNKKYPDRRAMGFPFDRKVESSLDTLDSLIHKYPNMRAANLKIQFTNAVIAKPKI